MTVLIIGNEKDGEAARIKTKLEQRKVRAEYLDTSRFPYDTCISFDPESGTGSLQLGSRASIAFTEIGAVYWRMMHGVATTPFAPADLQHIAYQDSMSLLRTFLRGSGARMVNSWEAVEFHKEKPRQLALAKQVGARLPRTLISNNAGDIRAFVDDARQYIFKPVSGGAVTELLTPAALSPDRLEMALKISPVTIQEYIPGANIRTFVVGTRVFTVEIVSDMVDFRADHKVDVVASDLPARETELARAIARAFSLSWTAIDWRRDPAGNYYFLEANPSPMFVCSEDRSGLPISDALVDLLAANEPQGSRL